MPAHCSKEYNSAYRKANKKRVYEYNKAYRAARPTETRAMLQSWVNRNKDRVKAIYRRYYLKHAEKRKAQRLEYLRSRPDIANAATARYRAAKMRAIPKWADRRQIAKFYAEAVRLSRETGIKHHVDHIVPLRSTIVCGLHVQSNLQVIPASVNSKKQNAVWPDMPSIQSCPIDGGAR